MLKVLLIFGFLAAGIVPLSAAQDKTENLQSDIDLLAEGTIKRNSLPSLQIAIGYKGDVVFEKAYGHSDLAAKKLATTNTLYRTASISKWLTGTATMRLVEEGAVDLDSPIQTYCPQFPEKPWPITTRQLLSHTSGIRHYAFLNGARHRAATDEEYEKVEAWAKRIEDSYTTRYTDVIAPLGPFKDDPLRFEPGTRHQYTSFGYRVLGCVLRGAADKPYNTIMREFIFEPAGMSSTTVDDSAKALEARATYYQFDSTGKPVFAPERDVSENLPAGGHLSTATDIVKFSQAFDQGALVNASTIELMSSLPRNNDGEEINAGYGHGVDFMGAFPGSLGHGGFQEGTTTLVILLPETDVSIAVFTNVSGWQNVNGFTKQVLEAFEKNLERDTLN
ncbi:serine hydrolase [Kordiimonas sp. SCSIO 12610]|uniref:serine hydrolase domain-containing protein n=1 Tax=Kordiimonas sp. SCSIO 12610 TaxID=2829597 RepID=UPI00210A076B|nr:serine hydrolase domain-containing protein [Kordiimonas sp. SCSIO 12610]UTW56168.1 beta-lactamase family protein [Kordiimonas sp. SCSIO 12610]